MIRKMRSKWQVIIRRKNYPTIVRSFIEKGTASKYAGTLKIKWIRKYLRTCPELKALH